MTPAEHDDLRALLAFHASGDLDPTEQARVDAHLSSCAACRDELAALGGALDALIRAGDRAPADPALDLRGFHDRRIAPATARSPGAGARWRGPLLRAAALLLAFGGGVAAERYAFGRALEPAEPSSAAVVSSHAVGDPRSTPPPGAARPKWPDAVVASYEDAQRRSSSELGRTLATLAALSQR